MFKKLIIAFVVLTMSIAFAAASWAKTVTYPSVEGSWAASGTHKVVVSGKGKPDIATDKFSGLIVDFGSGNMFDGENWTGTWSQSKLKVKVNLDQLALENDIANTVDQITGATDVVIDTVISTFTGTLSAKGDTLKGTISIKATGHAAGGHGTATITINYTATKSATAPVAVESQLDENAVTPSPITRVIAEALVESLK